VDTVYTGDTVDTVDAAGKGLSTESIESTVSTLSTLPTASRPAGSQLVLRGQIGYIAVCHTEETQ